jgi:hypothetical protein
MATKEKKYKYKKLSKEVREEILNSMTAFMKPNHEVYEEQLSKILQKHLPEIFKGYEAWVKKAGLTGRYPIVGHGREQFIHVPVTTPYKRRAHHDSEYSSLKIKYTQNFRHPEGYCVNNNIYQIIMEREPKFLALIKEFEAKMKHFKDTRFEIDKVLYACQSLNQLVETFPECEDHIPLWFIPDENREGKKETALVSKDQLSKVRKLLRKEI